MVMVLSLLAWLAVHLVTSPDYRVTEISVKGNDLIRDEELIQASKMRGQPILLLNDKQIEQSILKSKAIKSVEVHLAFPNRAVIEVVERPAAYVWKVRDTLYLVSDDGIVVGTTNTVTQQVAIVDIEGKDVAIGDQIDTDALKTARALHQLLPEEASIAPAYFEYSRGEGVVLPSDFAGRIVFGDSADLYNKVATLKSLRQVFKEQNLAVKYVDLRFKDRPYFR